MHKIFLLTFLWFCTYLCYGQHTDQKNSSFIADSVFIYVYNIETDKYDTSAKYIFTYDNVKNTSTKKSFEKVGSKWSLYKTSIKSFDDKDNLIKEAIEYPKEKYSTTKFLYTYNSNGGLIKKLTQDVDKEKWINDEQEIYTYDPKGNMESQKQQLWDGKTWIDKRSQISIYSSEGRLEKVKYFKHTNNQQIPEGERTYSYTNGNLDFDFFMVFEDDQFLNRYKTIYKYDSQNRLVMSIDQEWKDSTWKDVSRYSVSFDEKGNQTMELYEDYYLDEWLKVTQATNVYDYTNSFTTELWQDWNYGGNLNEKEISIVYFHAKK